MTRGERLLALACYGVAACAAVALLFLCPNLTGRVLGAAVLLGLGALWIEAYRTPAPVGEGGGCYQSLSIRGLQQCDSPEARAELRRRGIPTVGEGGS